MGEGQPVNSVFSGQPAACAGVDELSQGSAAAASSARAYDLPTFLRSSDGSSENDALGVCWETR